ncbi:9512_t:CDS:2 [Gigaspora margarita]|uniref:9512_t:CDS:1 n=1 Tax=Gigaspora margarita TaxID=4874 RepID=A0ABN7UIG5_GIGMA|nr:9512_t:CDS:2 [Gigaspora margarita]
MTQKFETRIPLTFEQNDDNFFKKNFINLFQCDSLENLDSVSTALSSNSFKVISKKYNKIVVLSKIAFSQKYTLNDFIIDLKKYQKVDLHENILKFIGIVKQSMNEFILYSSTNLLQHYIDLRNEITEKLEIITSILKALKMNHCDNDQRNNILNDSRSLTTNSNISNITKSQDNISNNDQKFLYDLNQLFITQFNIQGISKNCANFIINNINNYMNENNKNPDEIFVQYYNHQYKYYFTSIIGFFYEYGIGTTIDNFKAFEMYKQAADNFYFSHNNSLIENNVLKENHMIGLISLGIFYLFGNGVVINYERALQLFLKTVIKGSSLGKCYVGDCYYYGYGVIKNLSHSFNCEML